MKNAVIAGACRKSGKTLLACSLVRELAGRGCRTAAFKLSRGRQPCEVQILEGPGRPGSDTERLAAAGACRTALVRYSEPGDLVPVLASLPGGEDVTVWESNSAADILQADLLVYIAVPGCAEPKAMHLADSADLLLTGPVDAASAEAVASAAAGRLLEGLESERESG